MSKIVESEVVVKELVESITSFIRSKGASEEEVKIVRCGILDACGDYDEDEDYFYAHTYSIMSVAYTDYCSPFFDTMERLNKYGISEDDILKVVVKRTNQYMDSLGIIRPYVVIQPFGTNKFYRIGYDQDSYDGSGWDDDFYEVQPVEQTVTVWQ